MLNANDMSNLPISNIPQIWFVTRREYLETHYLALSELQQKISQITVSRNLVAILKSAKSLEELVEHVSLLEEKLSGISFYSSEYYPYNLNDIRRTKELALSTLGELNIIAKQISWGRNSNEYVAHINRNLYPLIQLLNKILAWLDSVIQ